MYLTFSVLAACLPALDAFCTGAVRRHNFLLDDVQGMWFGVGYAQHSPDLTNKPNKVGCLSMYISDVTDEPREDWTGIDPVREESDSSIPRLWHLRHELARGANHLRYGTVLYPEFYRRNWTDPDWRSPHTNPWSDTPISGSWMDYRIRHIAKREISHGERRLQVVWDEDGQMQEQNYIYSPAKPNVWRLEQWDTEQSEVYARGLANLDLWRPDDPPKRPEYIYVLKGTPNLLILYHCSHGGEARAFSLVLYRTPSPMASWDWYDIRKIFFTYQLPNVVRYSAICDASGGARISSGILWVLFSAVLLLVYC